MISFLNAMWGEGGRMFEREERRFRATMDAAPTAIVIADATRPDCPVVYVNGAFCQITGYRAEEVEGRNLRLLQGPGTDPAVKHKLAQALAAGEPVWGELLNYRKDGQPFWMRVEIAPMRDEHDRVVRFVGVMSDVTDSHRATEELRDREARLRAVSQVLPLPLLVVDGANRIVEANHRAQTMLKVEALVGRHLGEFLDVAKVLDDAPIDGSVHRVEIRVRSLDGDFTWALASVVRFRLATDDAAILVFVDIAGMKEKEAALSRALDEAERATRAKSRFFAAASHDLRQPLQALALFSSALEMHVSTPIAQTILQSLKVSLSTMEEMFDALLDMSRLEAGVLKPVSEVFMVNDVLERLEVEFAPQAARKGLVLRVVPSSAAVRSDPALLGRILRNFLSNALRYTQQGRILLGCKRYGERLAIIVADTGPGIPDAQRLAIFEEFYQADGTDASKAGLGLGLAIVQRLSRLLGHRLDVRSQVGRGSSFAVVVPLTDPPQSGEVAADIGHPGDVSGACVVVVDDDPAVLEGLCMLLEDWGCDVIAEETADAAAAALAASGKRPDVILADLHLAGPSSGMNTIDRILEGSEGKEVPAFVFTGDTDRRDGRTDPGGHPYRVLHKPLNPAKLRTVLAEALGR